MWKDSALWTGYHANSSIFSVFPPFYNKNYRNHNQPAHRIFSRHLRFLELLFFYICPTKALCHERYQDWTLKYSHSFLSLSITVHSLYLLHTIGTQQWQQWTRYENNAWKMNSQSRFLGLNQSHHLYTREIWIFDKAKFFLLSFDWCHLYWYIQCSMF